jgi:hypothetical protein
VTARRFPPPWSVTSQNVLKPAKSRQLTVIETSEVEVAWGISSPLRPFNSCA